MTYTKLIRRPAVLEKLGISKSTLYNKIQAEEFPPPISLGSRAVAFVESEVNEVLKEMVKGANTDRLKQVVGDLINQRKQIN